MHGLIDLWHKVRRAAGLAAAAALLLVADTAHPAEGTLTGHLLVAVPEMQDSNFAQTVVYLVEHDRRGALGVVVNEPMGEVPLGLLLDGQTPESGRPAPDETAPRVRVLHGGPVGRRQGFILHSTDMMSEGSVRIDQWVAYTRDPTQLRSLAGEKGPRHLVFAMGYAGWAPGQLEMEISHGGWYVIDWDETLVFGADYAAKWQRGLALHEPEL